MTRERQILGSAVAFLLAVAAWPGCGSNGTSQSQAGDGGEDATSPDSSAFSMDASAPSDVAMDRTFGGGTDAAESSTCGQVGMVCAVRSDCCGTFDCRASGNTCCIPLGDPSTCHAHVDCCNWPQSSCSGGHCCIPSAEAGVGLACSSDADCCSGHCVANGCVNVASTDAGGGDSSMDSGADSGVDSGLDAGGGDAADAADAETGCPLTGGADAAGADSGLFCSLGPAACDGGAASVDLCGDPNHCGACGTTCGATQACCSGSCATFGSTLFSADYAWGIAVDATSIYWTSNTGGSGGTVLKMPIGGSAVTTLASGQNAPQAIAVDGTSVYWLNGSGPPMTVPVGGGTPHPVATSSAIPQPHNLAIDDGYVYWTGDNGGVTFDAIVQRVSKCGGAPTTIATEPSTGGTADVVSDGAFVYYVLWQAGNNATTLRKVAATGGTPTTLAPGNLEQRGLALGSSVLYWKDCVISPLSCVVYALPVTGGTPRPVATDNSDWQSHLAVDSGYVYWTDWDPRNADGGYGPGAVYKAAIAGGPAIRLSGVENLPVGIAVDRRSVYWANYTRSGGSVRQGCK